MHECNLCDKIERFKKAGIDDYRAKQLAVKCHYAKYSRGDGQGQGGSRQGDGGASKCVCPKCGKEYSHEKGKPCSEKKCPKCGVSLKGK